MSPRAPLDGRHPAGMVRLGEDLANGTAVDLELRTAVARHILILGITGSGKTTTARRLIAAVLAAGLGAIVVDAKGGGLRPASRALAAACGVPYSELVPGAAETLHYNPCALGTHGQIADKLLGAYSFGTEGQVYKQLGMEAIATVVKGLRATGAVVSVRAISDKLSPAALGLLSGLVRPTDTVLADSLAELGTRGSFANTVYASTRARLANLLLGDFGELIEPVAGEGSEARMLDLYAALRTPQVTYISLPALANSEDNQLIARVLIQDLKQAAYRRLQDLDAGTPSAPALLFLDEFAALSDPEQISDLLRQAREAGIGVAVGTQKLPDDVALRAALVAAGLLICHEVDAEDAQLIADLIGTESVQRFTLQWDEMQGASERGSIREVEEYRVHPNTLKTLRAGEAVVLHRPDHAVWRLRIFAPES